MKIQIDSSGLNAWLAAFPKKMSKAYQDSLRQSAEKVTNRAKDTKYVPYWHGTLRSSIRYKLHATFAEVGTDLVYARIQEFGGTIRPVRAKALRFKTRDGKWVTTMKVVVPPYKGRGYLRPALADSTDEIKAIFQKNIANQIK